MLNIVHFTHGKVNPFGESGMSRTVYFLNKYQKMSGHNSQIWSVVDRVKTHEKYMRDEYVTIEMFARTNLFNFSTQKIVEHIKSNRNAIDIVHFHLMWLFDKNIVAKYLRKFGIPYIVTTHGAYAMTSIRNMWWKKAPAKYFYELKFLNKATAIHALCHEELTGLKEFGINRPIFVVPNGIELDEMPTDIDDTHLTVHHSIPKEKIKLAWIGILKPVKNLEGLIEAASILPQTIKNEVCFVLIGPDLRGYEKKLRKLACQYNVESMFYFVGPKFHKDKYDALSSADIYIHPSLSEGISFSILDAMACGKPCILTRTCNMTYYYNQNFFRMVEPWPDDIARGIVEMVECRYEWPQMAINAKRMIREEFTWEKINTRILGHYMRLIEEYSGKK